MVKKQKEKPQLKDPLSDPFFNNDAGKPAKQQAGKPASQQVKEPKEIQKPDIRKPLKSEKPGIVKVTGRLYLKTKRKLEDVKMAINRKTADDVTQDQLIAEAIGDLYDKYKATGIISLKT